MSAFFDFENEPFPLRSLGRNGTARSTGIEVDVLAKGGALRLTPFTSRGLPQSAYVEVTGQALTQIALWWLEQSQVSCENYWQCPTCGADVYARGCDMDRVEEVGLADMDCATCRSMVASARQTVLQSTSNNTVTSR